MSTFSGSDHWVVNRGCYVSVHHLDTQSKFYGVWLFFVRLSHAHKWRKGSFIVQSRSFLKILLYVVSPNANLPDHCCGSWSSGVMLPQHSSQHWQRSTARECPASTKGGQGSEGVEIRAWLLQMTKKIFYFRVFSTLVWDIYIIQPLKILSLFLLFCEQSLSDVNLC